ncbi:MAG: DUF5309 domain-containing protein [Minwuiales bacterium]|nr:DUF5309 domain-containing protein [Minwuiales bacterium]
MAVPTDTFQTYQTQGIREDLKDVIYRVDPTDTPFLTGVPKMTAKSTKVEWQTQDLAQHSADNAVVEGDDATADAATPTVRRDNQTQISDKVAITSGTNQSVESAGRTKNEHAYQKILKGLELRRDMEASLLANKSKVAGAAGVARVLAGIESWLATNTNLGLTGAAPAGDGSNTRTTGTDRPITEDLLKDILKQCWDEGGKPNKILVSSHVKGVISGFSGGSNLRRDIAADRRTLETAIEFYAGDFGLQEIIPSRFHNLESALVLQMDMWGVAFMTGRQFKSNDLAKTGDSMKTQILSEYTLVAKNEKASGIVSDLDAA